MAETILQPQGGIVQHGSPTRCVCTEPERGSFQVCRRCGGEYQKNHSSYCNCPGCSARQTTVREVGRG